MSNALKLADVELQVAEARNVAANHADILSWQSSLQAAMFNEITEADVQYIVRKQVEKAKLGDATAIKFVLGQLLGANRPVQINQTLVVQDVESAARIAKRGNLQ